MSKDFCKYYYKKQIHDYFYIHNRWVRTGIWACISSLHLYCNYLEMIKAQFLKGHHFICFDKIKNWKTSYQEIPPPPPPPKRQNDVIKDKIDLWVFPKPSDIFMQKDPSLIGTDLCLTWLNLAKSGERHNHMCPHVTHFPSLWSFWSVTTANEAECDSRQSFHRSRKQEPSGIYSAVVYSSYAVTRMNRNHFV